MEVVRGLAREKTVLLISHRLANVTAADEIFVLQAGTEGIAERGTHQELSLIHISQPTRLGMISYALFCLKKKNA